MSGKKEEFKNSLGWRMLVSEKGITIYSPENWFLIFLRYMSFIVISIVMIPQVIKKPVLIFALLVGYLIAFFFSRRELYPNFYVTHKNCAFNLRERFTTENAVLVCNLDNPRQMFVVNEKNNHSMQIWECADDEEIAHVIEKLSSFIEKRAFAKEEKPYQHL